MNTTPLDRTQLATFFAVRPRGLSTVLRRLGLPGRARVLPMGLVWTSIGLAAEQDPAQWNELTAPLLPAAAAAALLGVDPSTVYKWHDGKPARPGYPPMPRAIDLGGGQENTRGLRWRHAELSAWTLRTPLPRYERPAPVFGALTPTT